ncbi:hypothetical protein BGZ46_001304 [Entomortierella lignicola]|nr:hypothetical protein BGZ46_001304 [Entomortierella lignicola]
MAVYNTQTAFVIWGYINNRVDYTISTNFWSIEAPLPAPSTKQAGLRAVTDPRSGLIYIPSGANNGTGMVQFNPSNNNVTALSNPPTLGIKPVFYGAVWSTQRNSVLMYGGRSIDNMQNTSQQFFEYLPSTSSWSVVNTQGTSPGDTNNNCMVAANNGTKIIVFGGQTSSGTLLGSLFILNVTTMTWSQGASIDPTLNRAGMACAVSGDNLVVWGGIGPASSAAAFNAPSIYNIRANKWTTQFSLSDISDTTNPTSVSTQSQSPTPTPTSSQSKTSTGAIIGAVFGAAALIAATSLFVYSRQRKDKKRISTNTLENPKLDNINKDFEEVPQKENGKVVGNPHDPVPYKASISGNVDDKKQSPLGNMRNPQQMEQQWLPDDEYYSQPLKSPQIQKQFPIYDDDTTPLPLRSPHRVEQQWQPDETFSRPRDPQGTQPLESIYVIYEENDNLTEEEIERIRANQLEQYQQHQQHLEQIRLEQEAHIAMLQQRLSARKSQRKT